MKVKKKLLIVTANEILAYQPSILNLYDFLEPHFDISIISFEPEFIGRQKPSGRNVVYLKVPPIKKFLVLKFDFTLQLGAKMFRPLFPALKHNKLYYWSLQYRVLEKFLRQAKADELLAVDIPALYITQAVFGRCHFFSLELDLEDPFLKKIRIPDILSVVIQNKERYDYLFPGAQLPVFYIQNAPVFREEMIRSYLRADMVWAGSILKRFAVLECLQFVRSYPSFRLVLKGGAERKTLQQIEHDYLDLLGSKRVLIDQDYLDSGEFIEFLSHFRYGICFYSWDLIRESVNYQTAPSGKLFMYLAAGVPVIACNIPGFQFIREFRAGILVDDYRPETIYQAVQAIEEDFGSYSEACYRAARHFSFEKGVNSYIDFLTGNHP
jgi:glycosyltransferase involved in cell wall biosynthesis